MVHRYPNMTYWVQYFTAQVRLHLYIYHAKPYYNQNKVPNLDIAEFRKLADSLLLQSLWNYHNGKSTVIYTNTSLF